MPGIRNIVDKGSCRLGACSPAKERKTIIKSLSADIIGSYAGKYGGYRIQLCLGAVCYFPSF